MKKHLIILSVICLAAMTLRAQDTTAVRPDVRIRQNCDCGCHQHPVNDYDGLNSLRQRLANPSWDGKGELFRSIGTGMKVEDGRIVPLSKKSASDTVFPEKSSAISIQESASPLKPYLQQMERGEVPIGAPIFIFFRLASTYVTGSPQLLNIYSVADLAMAKNLKVRITGSADSMTGTLDKNASLAINRAKYVANLMKERGVSEEMIEIQSEGGTVQHNPLSANRNCKIELLVP